jgi:hypothetical protein
MSRQRARLLPVIVIVVTSSPAWPQGEPVGPEFQINTYTDLHQFGPSVARDSAGNFVVVWASSLPGGGATLIRGQRYSSSGAPAGSEFAVNSYAQGAPGYPAVASAALGNFVAVWAGSGQDDAYGVFGQRFDAAGGPLGLEFRVNTYTTGSQSRPSVASDPSGNFVVVWESFLQYGVLAQRYAASGVPLGPEFRVNTIVPGFQGWPSVAVGGSGNFVVAWQRQDGDSAGIFAQRYDSTGAPIAPQFLVNTYTTENQSFPAVASDATDNFIVTWASAGQEGEPGGGGGGPPLGVYGQRYSNSGAPLGPEFRVNTYTLGNQYLVSVATDATGNFVIVWASAQQDGSGNGVYGQRYESSGMPMGLEFRVNTFTTAAQAAPVVASDTAGNFVVVWTSDTQDGSGFGIFGQRYGPIVPVELMRFVVE